MPFTESWRTLLDECDALTADATLSTPLSETRFRLTDIQEHRIVIEFSDSGDAQPLQREQFETLAERITDASGTFDLQRLPPDAEPYAAVLSLHPRYEINDQAGTLTETDEPTTSQLITGTSGQSPDEQEQDRTEPDRPIYADMLLLIDALERHDMTDRREMETNALVNLYTLLSDVQRDANDLRKDVADVLLSRLHHDRSVSGPFGSVQRTTRRNRSLKDDEEVLAALEDAGIDRERVLGVDRDKVDDALDVTELSESDVYDVDESEYVRKAEVDEDMKETRLQGLKDRLAAAEDEDTEELRQEIEQLEERIDDLTSFRTGTEMQE